MKKDNKNIVAKLREKIKPENRVFVKKNLAISEQISFILNKKGWNQKTLAEKMGKETSEVCKLLSGLHNLTLQSVANIEAALGEDIIITPLEAKDRYKTTQYVILSASANVNCNIGESKQYVRIGFKKCNQEKLVS